MKCHRLICCSACLAGFLAVTSSARAGSGCPCDGDVNQSGEAFPVNFQDIAIVADCAKGVDCSGCLSSCDIDCDGVVDFVDMAAADCHFNAGTSTGSGCCDLTIGACVGGNNLPECVDTSRDACDLFAGSFAGANTICINGEAVGIPTASTWGLIVLTLSLAAAATAILRRRRPALASARF